MNREMSSADAVLTDWDGQISVLERQALSILYAGNVSNQEVCINKTNGNEVIPNTATITTNHNANFTDTDDSLSLVNSEDEQQQCCRRSSTYNNTSSNQSAMSDRGRDGFGTNSTIGRNESVYGISRPPSSRLGSFYQQGVGASSMLNDSITEIIVALLATLAVQDFIEILVLSSYCIECYILKVHLLTLSQKLLLHSIDSLDWMREILQFRKLLDRLNNHVSLPVCFFVVMNLAYAFAGFVYMFKDFDFHYSALKIVILNFTNVLLWLILGLLPFFMAASLTQACQSVKANGHQIRVRPFVYHNASVDDLNSMLMFSSTLDMSASLFRMPIQSNYICFGILIISIVILTVGMCFNLSVLGIFKF